MDTRFSRNSTVSPGTPITRFGAYHPLVGFLIKTMSPRRGDRRCSSRKLVYGKRKSYAVVLINAMSPGRIVGTPDVPPGVIANARKYAGAQPMTTAIGKTKRNRFLSQSNNSVRMLGGH